MSEDEIEKLREEKMKNLQEREEAESQEQDQKERIKAQASKYFTDEASSRLGNKRLTDPDLVAQIETRIMQLGRTGQISEGEITDEQVKRMLKDLQGSGKDSRNISFRKK